MRRTSTAAAVILTLVLAARVDRPAAQSGYDLFQKALAAERADGNLREAIQLYARVVKEFGADRTLSARALVRMAECYEKLGDAESQGIYDRVAREFADQTESAATARARLAVLQRGRPPTPVGIVSRQVSTEPGIDALGSVAPDGRSLSFVDWETGDLAIRNLETGTNRRLTSKGTWQESPEFALFSRISLDGRLIAYNWMNRNFGWEIRVGPIDGSSYRVVWRSNINYEYAHAFAWSPDGRTLAALISFEGQDNQLALIAVADGSRRTLKSFDWRGPGGMAFSPDGRYVTYDVQVAEQSPERDIFVLAVDGSRETRVVDHAADDYLLGWLADGRLLFASDRAGSIDAWTLHVANGTAQGPAELLKKDLGNSLSLGVTRTGALFYGLRSSGFEVYTATIDPQTRRLTGTPTRLPRRFIGANNDPDWSPDGRRVAYVSARSFPPTRIGATVLSILDVDTGMQRDLPVRLGYISRPRWSPDGSALLFRANDERGREGFFLASPTAGSVTLLVRRQGLRDAVWSADGTRIFVATTDYSREALSGTGQIGWITALDPATREEKELYRETTPTPAGDAFLTNLAASPDGARIAFTVHRGRTNVVMALTTTTGQAKEIFRSTGEFEPTNFGGLTWAPDGTEILLVKASSATSEVGELWALPANGGTLRPLGLRMDRLRKAAIRPAHGDQVVFQAGRQTWEVWALENLQPARR
jgi:Tol biopolymer transport system component